MALESAEDKLRVEQVVQRLWQGDLVATPVVPVLESPHSSFVDGVEALEPVDSDGLWTVAPQEITTGWSAIVTQTCDVVRHPDAVPYLQLMPIVELEGAGWQAAQNGRRGGLFALPQIEGLPVAYPAIDCMVSFPVSKAALLHEAITTLPSDLDPATRILLSSWLMRRVGRFAFPDELETHVLAPLRQKVASAMGKNSQAGAFCQTLLGVWASTEWGATASVIFVVDPNRVAASKTAIDAAKAINELLRPIHKHLGNNGIPVQVTGEGRDLSSVSAYRLFIEHRQVDMDVLPTGEFVETAGVATQNAAG